LTYDSSTHDRDAGYGWGLELPVIELKPLSGNPCFEPDGTPLACWKKNYTCSNGPVIVPCDQLPPENNIEAERYTFNGQPLVFICQLPAPPGACDPNHASEPQPDWTADGTWRYFRLQVEGEFSRFYLTLSENRKYWRVQLRGGGLLEFGEPPLSTGPGVERPADNENAIFRWRLVRESDFTHKNAGEPLNFVSYRWKVLGKRELLYLTDIFDTPRANNPSDFAHHTQLAWQSPSFQQTSYTDPYRATPDLRLSSVAVSSMPLSAAGPREIIRTYFLSYAPEQTTAPTQSTTAIGGGVTFNLWHHSFLTQISMEGRCAQFEDPYDGNTPPDRHCPQNPHGVLPPTTFEYQGVTGIALIAAFISKVDGATPLPNGIDPDNPLPYLNSVAVLDFNGDGFPDIVQSWNAERCELDRREPINSPRYSNPVKVGLNDDYIECLFKTEGLGPDLESIQSTRPIIGYENVGTGPSTSPYVHFAPQCMDAGQIDDPTGLTHYNVGQVPGFLSSSAASLVASWGEGTVAWSNANYAPYRARPLIPAYELRLMKLDGVVGLPTTGNSLVIVAKIGDFYQVRIFDKDGNKVLDRGKDEFVPDDSLKDQMQLALDGPPLTGPDQQNFINTILTALKYSLPFEAGSGCNSAVAAFNTSDFHPGWKWEQTKVNLDWAKAAIGEPDPSVQHLSPRWFVDIDGDGWIDRLEESGTPPLGNFQPAIVAFTSVYGKGDKPAIPGSAHNNPAEIPFVSNGDEAISLAPSAKPPPAKWPCGTGPDPSASIGKRVGTFECELRTRFYYVDINGDGLVDLVEYNPVAFNNPRVRLGDGKGHFTCDPSKQPWPCLPSNPGEAPAYEIENIGPPNLFNVYDEDVYFHDITGDGLADLVKYDKRTGLVSVWVNLDGHKFACLSYTPNCGVAYVLDERTGSPDIGEHKITFADMYGDGTDDLVILTHRGAYVVRFMPTFSPISFYGVERPNRVFLPEFMMATARRRISSIIPYSKSTDN
jgi:hypothetical protein